MILKRFLERKQKNEEAHLLRIPDLLKSKTIEMQISKLCADTDKMMFEVIGANDYQRARTCFELWESTHRLRDVVEKITFAENKAPLYLVNSLFLHECFQCLTKGSDEAIHFVTGSELGRIITLDKVVNFKIEAQSSVFVKGNVQSTHKVLIDLEKYGHKLYGWFHSHPGRGPGATLPSQTDTSHQERLERGGYPAIGAIFSRDGQIRFFSLKREFRITIHGKGVECVDERQKLFCLAEVS